MMSLKAHYHYKHAIDILLSLNPASNFIEAKQPPA